jgi:hypothetical protein
MAVSTAHSAKVMLEVFLRRPLSEVASLSAKNDYSEPLVYIAQKDERFWKHPVDHLVSHSAALGA